MSDGNGESGNDRDQGTATGALRALRFVALGVDQAADGALDHVDVGRHRRRRDRDQRPGHGGDPGPLVDHGTGSAVELRSDQYQFDRVVVLPTGHRRARACS